MLIKGVGLFTPRVDALKHIRCKSARVGRTLPPLISIAIVLAGTVIISLITIGQICVTLRRNFTNFLLLSYLRSGIVVVFVVGGGCSLHCWLTQNYAKCEEEERHACCAVDDGQVTGDWRRRIGWRSGGVSFLVGYLSAGSGMFRLFGVGFCHEGRIATWFAWLPSRLSRKPQKPACIGRMSSYSRF